MPPPADRSPSSVASALSGRRLISRITHPFTSKSRTHTDFSIEVDDPHRQYSPGDVVSGSVRVRVPKPVRVTHIAVCLHGYVQVFKNPGSRSETSRPYGSHAGTGGGKKSGEYFGNGFASLFEDEQVLCGEGRLSEGAYHFNFELEFPDKDLPSSIDFERGTISYMITATMTRPTTISPVTTCDRKIYFVERIDISRLYPPKSRTITLEPLSKRTRAKKQARKLVDATERRSRKTDSSQPSEPARASAASSSIRAESEAPGSPAPSVISLDSLVSSGRTSQPDSNRPSPGTSETSKINASKVSLAHKTISVTVESLTGGCLRGDHVNLKINVSHTKAIKSLYGVIVTLYRQARVDMHPSIPLGPTEKGVESKFEDYYPKSITGLGGLSLSGAGSNHLFRKDLAQVMLPLYIDPTSLTADITTKIRVPEEAFPTISTVPGDMISFKYYVEVILDIQGKLGGSDRHASSVTGGVGGPSYVLDMDSTGQGTAFIPLLTSIVDTAPIRRDKGVVTCTFEVVVGTRDSERRKGKRKVEAHAESELDLETDVVHSPLLTNTERQMQHPTLGHAEQWVYLQSPENRENAGWYSQDFGYYDPRYYDPSFYDPRWQYYYDDSQYNLAYYPPPPTVPIPQMPDETRMTEKERVQQAEARLLPSQPPGTDEGAARVCADAPSAPYLSEEAASDPTGMPGPSAAGCGPASGSAGMTAAAMTGTVREQQCHSVPQYVPAAAGPSTVLATTVMRTDDKQELEQQRLRAQESAPPEDEDAEQSSTARTALPTAPALEASDEGPFSAIYDSHADAAAASGLPRYER